MMASGCRRLMPIGSSAVSRGPMGQRWTRTRARRLRSRWEVEARSMGSCWGKGRFYLGSPLISGGHRASLSLTPLAHSFTGPCGSRLGL